MSWIEAGESTPDTKFLLHFDGFLVSRRGQFHLIKHIKTLAEAWEIGTTQP